jgi:hypothetical protein
MRVTGGCTGCTNGWLKNGSADGGAAGQRMRQRAAVDVFQFAAHRHAVGDARGLDAAAQTAELTREVEGRHTTTTSRRYRLESGADAAVIDAPGVRDFAPPASMVRAAELGFVEIHRFAADCRFNDCRHLEEPGCAVRSAVFEERIAARRYESYRRLRRLYEKLAP